MQRFTLPKILGSERLDTVIEILESMRTISEIEVDWQNVSIIDPAGKAIISILIDQAIEKNCLLIHINLTDHLKKQHPLLKGLYKKNGLPENTQHNFRDKSSFILCCQGGIDLHYKELLTTHFSQWLDEDTLFSIQLVVNELIQNAVDHSTSERYYIYFGILERYIHFGVLDMGVTLPSKMEQKYSAESDIDFLEMSLIKGVTTRRIRVGGLGLFHTLEMIKDVGGKFVFISRDGQIRRYFSQRKISRMKLKNRLYGTWVMFAFKKRRSSDDN